MSASLSTRKRTALFAVCLASLMFGLEISSVPVILPTLERVLGGDFRQMQWVMNAYTIASTTVLMAAGALADRFGRRRVFLVSGLLFGASSVMCGLAGEVGVLIFARALQGMSGGALLISMLAILSHQFREGRERGKAFAAWGVVFGFGLGFGPLIGGAIVALSDWTWVFLVHGPIAVLTLLLVLASVDESRDPQARRLDLGGMLSLSLAVLGLTFYLTQAGAMGFAGGASLGVLAATASSVAVFVAVERRASHPMFDFSVLRNRGFSGALLGSMGMNFSFWPLMVYLPIYFHGVLGLGELRSGIALLAYTLPALVFPPVGERLSLHYRPGLVIPAGLFTIGIGLLLMHWGTAQAKPGLWTVLPGALIAGVGLGITNTPVTNTATGAVSPDRAGMASGLDMSARLISLAINIALMGLLLVRGVQAALQQHHAAAARPDLHRLAERIAAGDVGGDPAAAAALAHGFGWVTLYGGVSVCLLAFASLWVFGAAGVRRKARVPCVG
ncbi:MFS transporter [Marilutibacter chinensis]|uniref:MFS transporter n=1 Tax=Marilutibacter chinensis TaxID=2912247 RepID=A0ABS9HQA1_9GAMM|nr:MFS transporter [Lysobacter chinensis]MCF7220325.1 MFS transporter [Lysobacter chinensis]